MNTLKDWLNYIQGDGHKQAILPGLKRMRPVAEQLGLIQFQCPIITVAGTNGKGSCVTLLTAILKAAGYQVGTYISPHLLRFNERIQINAQPVEDLTLCRAFEAIEGAKQAIHLSYFEYATLAAFWIFAQMNLDVLVLEVGMGGRLDAVNMLDADVSIITNISLDHCHWLGQDRESIGREKAGIIRKKTPIIYGEEDIPQSIVEIAEAHHAPLYQLGHAYYYAQDDHEWRWKSHQLRFERLPLPNKLLLCNAAAVLMAVECLQNRLTITREAIEEGLKKASIRGRIETLRIKQRNVVLDVAHNPASARVLAEYLKPLRCHFILGMLKDKDIEAVVTALAPLAQSWHLASLHNERGACAQALFEQCAKPLQKSRVPCYTYPSVGHAWHEAIRSTCPGETITVTGSFHTVADLLLELA